MMKRLVFAVLLLLFAAVAFPALAQTDRLMIAPAPSTSDSRLFGQEHHYSVTFRGNGEAIVLMKDIFSNQTDAPLTSARLEVPGVNPEELVVYQVLKDPVCVQYGANYSYRAPSTTGVFVPDPNCLQYRDPEYTDFLYGDARFAEAKVTAKGGQLDVALPTAVAADKSGALLVHYRSSGYTSRTAFGAYTYEFETLKVKEPVVNVMVGISTDADQVLKGGQGQVQYQQGLGDTSLKAAEAAVSRGGAQLNNYYNMIGQGDVIKQASNLDAGESYIVKGAYAPSMLQLYAQDIITAKLILLAIVVLVVVALRAVLSRGQNKTAQASETVRLATLTVIGSFLLSLIVVGKTIGLVYLLNQLSTMAYSSFMFSLGSIFLVVMAVFLYALIVLVPAVVLGMKKGLWWGLGLFGATIMWLGLYLVGFMIFLLVSKPSVPQYPIMPLQGGTMMEKEAPAMQDVAR